MKNMINKSILQYIPEKYYTYEICKAAVMESGKAISLIPESMKSEEICKIAISNYGGALRHIPDELKTFDMCMLALECCGWDAMVFIPPEIISDELYIRILEIDGKNICRIPSKYLTEDMINIAFTSNKGCIRYLDDIYKTVERCKLAVEYDPLLLCYVPVDIRDFDMCRKAIISGGPGVLKYIPSKIFRDSLYMDMVNSEGLYLIDVPTNKRTNEICKAAVKNNPQAIQYVPKNKKTKEICQIAMSYLLE